MSLSETTLEAATTNMVCSRVQTSSLYAHSAYSHLAPPLDLPMFFFPQCMKVGRPAHGDVHPLMSFINTI